MTGCSHFHGGQAAAEALLALGVFGALWILGSAVGRLQDLALQTEFAGRHLVFAVAQDTPPEVRDRVSGAFFDSGRHRWRNHDGSDLLAAGGARFAIDVGQVEGRLPEQALPGGSTEPARMLRQELLPAYPGMVAGRVAVAPNVAPAARAGQWRAAASGLSSRYFILADAGHARDDGDVQARIGQARQAWRDAAQRTERAGRDLAPLARIDRAWSRPLPQYDWLSAWKGLVPPDASGGAP